MGNKLVNFTSLWIISRRLHKITIKRSENMKKTFFVTMLVLFCFFSFQITKSTAAKDPTVEITMEKAKQIALGQVKGKIVSAKIETEDGMTKFEIIIQAQNGRYEIEIDKTTGKVLEVEKEGSSDGRHDDDGEKDDDDRNDD
jgi:uncharacterized membrane protein YkoI